MTYNVIRSFQLPGDPEPNEHYRPWIEKHIGRQGETWQWRIHSVNDNLLEILFFYSEDAVLFELTWP